MLPPEGPDCDLLSPALVTSLPQTHPTLTQAAPQLYTNKLSTCPWDHSCWGALSGPLCVALCVRVTSSDASPTQSLSHPSLNYLHGSYLVSVTFNCLSDTISEEQLQRA